LLVEQAGPALVGVAKELLSQREQCGLGELVLLRSGLLEDQPGQVNPRPEPGRQDGWTTAAAATRQETSDSLGKRLLVEQSLLLPVALREELLQCRGRFTPRELAVHVGIGRGEDRLCELIAQPGPRSGEAHGDLLPLRLAVELREKRFAASGDELLE